MNSSVGLSYGATCATNLVVKFPRSLILQSTVRFVQGKWKSLGTTATQLVGSLPTRVENAIAAKGGPTPYCPLWVGSGMATSDRT